MPGFDTEMSPSFSGLSFAGFLRFFSGHRQQDHAEASPIRRPFGRVDPFEQSDADARDRLNELEILVSKENSSALQELLHFR